MPGSAIHDVIWGGVTLKQCRKVEFNAGGTVAPDFTTGDVAPSDHYLISASPKCAFTCGDLAGVIAGLSSQFLAVAAGTITVPFNLRAAGSTFAGSSSHDIISATDGLLVINSFSASQGEQEGSSVSLTGYFKSSDGVTVPVTIGTGQTLSSNAYNATHKLGPSTINGSAIDGITRVTVNTGINVLPDMTDGAIYPTDHYINRIAPSIDVTGRRVSLFTALGPIFTTQTAAVFKFRKRASGGTVVSAATSAHLSFTFADGITEVQQVSGSGNSDAEVTLRLYGEALTISSTATI